MVFVKSDESTIGDTTGTATASSGTSARTSCIAHLSDLHLFNPRNMLPRDFITKRVLGYLSWRLHRRAGHQLNFMPALLDAFGRADVDHIVISGDVTHLGHDADFETAAEMLRQLGGPGRLTLIPGNHDAYVRSPWRDQVFKLAAYMASDPAAGVEPGSEALQRPEPSFRKCGATAVIGISSARPTAPFLATGSVGRAQLERLGRILTRTGADHLFRLVLIHHPPVQGLVSRRRCLTDQPALAEVIRTSGAELILHGHTHRFGETSLEGPDGEIPVIGVPSLTALSGKGDRRAGFRLYRIYPAGGGWNVTIETYRYSVSRSAFVSAGSRALSIGTAANAADLS